EQSRLKEVDGVPIVRMAASLAAQVGTDPSGPKKHGPLEHVLVFLGLGDRTEAPILVRDGSHKLTMAVPAAFSNIDSVTLDQSRASLGGQPVLARGGVLRWSAIHVGKAVGKAPRQVLELKAEVAVLGDDLFGRSLRNMAIHQRGQQGVRQER